MPSVFTFAAFFLIFLFCEIGERIDDESNIFYEQICSTEWYSFPKVIQKILPIIIAGIQEPLGLSGYGSIICTREAFKNVRHSISFITFMQLKAKNTHFFLTK